MADAAPSSAPSAAPSPANPPASPRARPLLGPPQVLAAYALLFLGQLIISVPVQSADVVAGLWVGEVIAIALPAVIWMAAAGVRPGPYLGLGLDRRAMRWLLVAVVTAALNQPVVSLLEYLAHQILPHAWVLDFDAKNEMLERIFSQHAWSFAITVMVAAPLGEELFFRGFAQQAFRRGMSMVVAALLTGALFSLIHVDPVGFVGLWEIGLWLAVLRYGSGSIWPAVLGHALNNGVAAISFVAGWQDPSLEPPLWLNAAGAILLPAGLFWAWRVLRGPAGHEAVEVPVSSGRMRVEHRRAMPLWIIWGLAAVAGAARLWTMRR